MRRLYGAIAVQLQLSRCSVSLSPHRLADYAIYDAARYSAFRGEKCASNRAIVQGDRERQAREARRVSCVSGQLKRVGASSLRPR